LAWRRDGLDPPAARPPRRRRPQRRRHPAREPWCRSATLRRYGSPSTATPSRSYIGAKNNVIGLERGTHWSQ